VTTCDFNQNCKHWLFKDALKFIITKACEFHDDINLVVPNNMGDLEPNVFDAKRIELMIHMKHQTLKVFQPFFSFFNGFDKKRGHNMLPLMFNSRFKSMQLVANYLGHETTFLLVVEYDGHMLSLLLM
jgi:hypothetical protein